MVDTPGLARDEQQVDRMAALTIALHRGHLEALHRQQAGQRSPQHVPSHLPGRGTLLGSMHSLPAGASAAATGGHRELSHQAGPHAFVHTLGGVGRWGGSQHSGTAFTARDMDRGVNAVGAAVGKRDRGGTTSEPVLWPLAGKEGAILQAGVEMSGAASSLGSGQQCWGGSGETQETGSRGGLVLQGVAARGGGPATTAAASAPLGAAAHATAATATAPLSAAAGATAATQAAASSQGGEVGPTLQAESTRDTAALPTASQRGGADVVASSQGGLMHTLHLSAPRGPRLAGGKGAAAACFASPAFALRPAASSKGPRGRGAGSCAFWPVAATPLTASGADAGSLQGALYAALPRTTSCDQLSPASFPQPLSVPNVPQLQLAGWW